MFKTDLASVPVPANLMTLKSLEQPSPVQASAVFSYVYAHPFNQLAAAWVSKYTWEKRTTLTTVANAQQLDEDRIQFYRRMETVGSDIYNYERVTIDRKAKTIVSDVIQPLNKAGEEFLSMRSTLKPLQGDESKTV